MAALEIGEPDSVSGSASVAAASESVISFCEADVLTQGRSLATWQAPEQCARADLLISAASPRLTAHVVLSDHVTVAFGDAAPLV